jgi:hypothetical protein
LPNLAEVARKLGVGELTVLFELRILGQPRGANEVPEEIMATLRTILGADAQPEGAGHAVGPPLGDSEEVRQDTNPRRRIVRRICEKLVSNGKWAPNGMLTTTLARGFADAGEARAAMEVLHKVSWLSVSATRRGYGDVLYALNPAFKSQILALIDHAEARVPPELEAWMRA